MNAPTLLPCPFCRGPAAIERPGTSRQSMIVACEYCGARVESGDVLGMTPDGSLSWNRRDSADLDRLRAALRGMMTGSIPGDDGRWDRVAMPTDAAMNAARAALEGSA